MSSRVYKFRYDILFTFLMDRGRVPNGIGHLMILFSDIFQRWKGTVSLNAILWKKCPVYPV